MLQKCFLNDQIGRPETVPQERSTPGRLPHPHPRQSLSPELGVPRPPGRLLPRPPRSHFLPPPRPFHIPVPPGQPRARRSQPAAHHPPLRARLSARQPGMKAAQAAGEEAPLSGRSVKVVLVGDGGCGKTSLMMVFADGAFPEVSALTLAWPCVVPAPGRASVRVCQEIPRNTYPVPASWGARGRGGGVSQQSLGSKAEFFRFSQ